MKSVDPRHPIPSKWSLMPRAQRAAIRWAATLGPPLAAGTGVWLWFYHHTLVLVCAWLSVALVVGWIAWLIYRASKRASYRRHTVIPFTQAAAPIVDLPPSVIERDMRIEPDRVRIPIPQHFNPRENELGALTTLANRRLTGEWKAVAQYKRLPFYVMLTRKPEPVGMYPYVEFLADVLKQKAGNLILGKGVDGLVTADIYNTYPMIGASMGTGAGKSSFLRAFLAQESYHGVDDWDLCDVKMVSLAGMENTPGLRIHRTPAEIRKAIHDTKLEMERRYQELLVNPDKVFARRYLILEEQNAFAIMTNIDWKESGGKGMDPVWDDIKQIIVMARQVGIHVIGMYQLLLAAVTGGDSTIRTQFSLKILSRFSPQAWDMLVGERPREPSSNVPGRAVAVMEGERKRFQIPYVTVDEAMSLIRMGKAWRKHNGVPVVRER